MVVGALLVGQEYQDRDRSRGEERVSVLALSRDGWAVVLIKSGPRAGQSYRVTQRLLTNTTFYTLVFAPRRLPAPPPPAAVRRPGVGAANVRRAKLVAEKTVPQAQWVLEHRAGRLSEVESQAVRLRVAHPELTMAQLAKLVGWTKDRMSTALRRALLRYEGE